MPSYAYAYNSASQDAFDRWSEARRDVRLGVSSQYLPADMQAYAPLLDESGDWRQTESYGYAWYPRVAPDWRPYYYGRWDSYPRYGWTWIGADRFAWPTHHYGRWGFSAGAWFWIPSSRWAPAYVSWAYAPGYVSWCPLGFDNRPIFAHQCLPHRLLAVARLDGAVLLAFRRPRLLGALARGELGSLQPASARASSSARRPRASDATSRSRETPRRSAGRDRGIFRLTGGSGEARRSEAEARLGRDIAARRRPRLRATSIAATRSFDRRPSGHRRARDRASREPAGGGYGIPRQSAPDRQAERATG